MAGKYFYERENFPCRVNFYQPGKPFPARETLPWQGNLSLLGTPSLTRKHILCMETFSRKGNVSLTGILGFLNRESFPFPTMETFPWQGNLSLASKPIHDRETFPWQGNLSRAGKHFPDILEVDFQNENKWTVIWSKCRKYTHRFQGRVLWDKNAHPGKVSDKNKNIHPCF